MSGIDVLAVGGAWVVLLAAVVGWRRFAVARALRGLRYTAPVVAALDTSEVPPAIQTAVQLASEFVGRGFTPLGTYCVRQAEGIITWYAAYASAEPGVTAVYMVGEPAGADEAGFLQLATEFDDGHEMVTIDGGAETLVILGPGRTVVDSQGDDPSRMLEVHLANLAERCRAGHRPLIADADGFQTQLQRELNAYFERQVASGELQPAGEGQWRQTWAAAWRDAKKLIGIVDRRQGRRWARSASSTRPTARPAGAGLYLAVIIGSLALIFATVRARSPDGALAPEAASASARESSSALAERLAAEYATGAEDGPPPGSDGSTVTLGLGQPLAVAFRDEADYGSFLDEVREAAGRVAAAHRGVVDLPIAGDAFETVLPAPGAGYITLHLMPWSKFVATSPPPDIRKRPFAHMRATAAALRTWAEGQPHGVSATWARQAESIQLRVTKDGPATLGVSQAALLMGVRKAAERRGVGSASLQATYLVVVCDATYPYGQ